MSVAVPRSYGGRWSHGALRARTPKAVTTGARTAPTIGMSQSREVMLSCAPLSVGNLVQTPRVRSDRAARAGPRAINLSHYPYSPIFKSRLKKVSEEEVAAADQCASTF